MNKNNANYYSNLPPTNTFVGNIEPFYDETIEYIENHKKARINAKVDIYDDFFHAFALFGSKKMKLKQLKNELKNLGMLLKIIIKNKALQEK